VERKKQPWVPADVIWTEDFREVLSSEADIVIELIGGLTPAEEFLRSALLAGKSVVTANKQLIARHGPDLLQLANRTRCQLEFGASVAGGVRFCPRCGPGCAETAARHFRHSETAPATTFSAESKLPGFLSARPLKKPRPVATPKRMPPRTSMAATLAPSSQFSPWPDYRPVSLPSRYEPAPFGQSMPSTSITPQNWAARSAKSRGRT